MNIIRGIKCWNGVILEDWKDNNLTHVIFDILLYPIGIIVASFIKD